MMRVLTLLVMVGCANVQPGIIHPTDTDCGRIGTVAVHLRYGVTTWPAVQTCASARALVARYADVLNEDETVEFTTGATGYHMCYEEVPNPHGMASHTTWSACPSIGTYYPATHVIEVNAWTPYPLAHEFGHAYDTENGLPNTRDGRR